MTKTNAPASRRVILTFTVAAAVFATAMLVALSWWGSSRDAEELYSEIPQRGTTLGEADAPVEISIYEDYQCPFCGQFSRETLPGVIANHVRNGEATVESRPMTFLGPDSFEAAGAALAAGGQDRYWQYHSLLFENQRAENSGYVTDEFLGELARQVPGLDVAAWNDRRAAGYGESELREVEAEARAAGIDATPTVVVSGPAGERVLGGEDGAAEVSAAVREVKGP